MDQTNPRLVVEQAHLRGGGGVEVDFTGKEPTFRQAAQSLDIFEDCGQAIVRHLFPDLAPIEAEQFPEMKRLLSPGSLGSPSRPRQRLGLRRFRCPAEPQNQESERMHSGGTHVGRRERL